MLHVEPYRGDHLGRLVEAHGISLLAPLEPYYNAALETAGPAYTGFVDGLPVAAAGIANLWPGRAEAWAVMTPATRHHMTAITRAVRAFLDLAEVRRIDCAVKADFEAGHRWARLLGFEQEGVMRAYGPDGCDYARYARVRG